MTKRDLLCVLIGVVITVAAFAYRSSVQRQEQMEQRIDNIEQFLVAQG